MAEDLTEYLQSMNIRVRYLHSEIKALERVEIIRDLRLGQFDVLIGVNLLREGLDLPEVSLVAIMDADKEGFLRSESALILTIGRAARNSAGVVVLYADTMTDSMRRAIGETERRREKQMAHNTQHGITPTTIKKEITYELLDRVGNQAALEEQKQNRDKQIQKEEWEAVPPEQLRALIEELEISMKAAAKMLEFEKAAKLRDQMMALKAVMDGESSDSASANNLPPVMPKHPFKRGTKKSK
jgi:excinuclease ABC subunit B